MKLFVLVKHTWMFSCYKNMVNMYLSPIFHFGVLCILNFIRKRRCESFFYCWFAVFQNPVVKLWHITRQSYFLEISILYVIEESWLSLLHHFFGTEILYIDHTISHFSYLYCLSKRPNMCVSRTVWISATYQLKKSLILFSLPLSILFE